MAVSVAAAGVGVLGWPRELDLGPPPSLLALAGEEQEPVVPVPVRSQVATEQSSAPAAPVVPTEQRTRLEARRVLRLRASPLAIEVVLEPMRSELEELTGREIVFDLDSDRGAACAVAAGVSPVAVFAGPLTRRDKEQGLQEECLGYHVLAAVVSNNNPVTGLSRQSLKELLTGVLPSWVAVGAADCKVEVVAMPAASSLEIWAATLALAADPLSAAAVRVLDPLALAARVASVPAAVALLPLASLKQGQLRTLAVDGVLPSAETARSGSYPFVVPIVIATRGTPDAETAELIRCLQSAAGLDIRSRVLSL